MHLLDEHTTWDPFPPSRRHDDARDRRSAHRAVAASAVGLAIAGVVELAIALLSGSVGLLGDALHNLSDVSTAAVVFLGFQVSKRPASASRPYGSERAEDLAGLAVALVIWASGVVAGVASYHKLAQHGRTTHLGIGMTAAAIGVVANQVVARYKASVGRRIQSAALLGDARHSWLDALSSAGALLGLTAVAVGWRWGDALAGLVVTGLIIHVGWDVTRGLVQHIMDGVDPAIVAAAEHATGAVPAVHHAHVRARWMGRSLLLEVEGFIDAETSVADIGIPPCAATAVRHLRSIAEATRTLVVFRHSGKCTNMTDQAMRLALNRAGGADGFYLLRSPQHTVSGKEARCRQAAGSATRVGMSTGPPPCRHRGGAAGRRWSSAWRESWRWPFRVSVRPERPGRRRHRRTRRPRRRHQRPYQPRRPRPRERAAGPTSSSSSSTTPERTG